LKGYLSFFNQKTGLSSVDAIKSYLLDHIWKWMGICLITTIPLWFICTMLPAFSFIKKNYVSQESVK